MRRRHAAHHQIGDEQESGCRERGGNDQAAVERVHDLASGARLDAERADDRRQDREPAQRERIRNRRDRVVLEQERAEQHGRDDRHRIGLEQVGCHPSAISHVVTDVVGDHRWVARIVFRYSRLDLANQVGADIGALGEDAAAQPREDRDQRAPEGQPDERLDDGVQPFLVCVWNVRPCLGQKPVEAGNAEQPQADDEHAGDRAAAKGNGQRFVETGTRSFRRAHIGANRHVHADETGQPRKNGTDGEAAGGCAVQKNPDDHEQDDADDAYRRVLPIEIRLRPGLNGGGNFLHACVTRGFGQDPRDCPEAVDQCGDRADEREDECV